MKFNDLVHRVKSHPSMVNPDPTGVSEDNLAFAIDQVVPSSLMDLITKVAPTQKRAYLFTDPAVLTVTLGVDGTVDLQDTIDSDNILLEYIHLGEMSHVDYEQPLSPARHSGIGVLPGNYDAIHGHWWLVGTVLHTRGDGDPLTGDLALALIQEQSLDSLKAPLEDDLVDLVVNRLRATPLPTPTQ